MINEEAPVVSKDEIEVAAPAEVVWQTLTDFQEWPRWNKAVKSLSMDGDVTPGSTFRWKSGSSTLTSTIQRVEPPRLILWTGKTMGIDAVHVYRLSGGAGRTHVNTEESWQGLLVTVLRGRLQRTLDKSVAEGLQALKAEAERRAQVA
jgi:hypothetical protein